MKTEQREKQYDIATKIIRIKDALFYKSNASDQRDFENIVTELRRLRQEEKRLNYLNEKGKTTLLDPNKKSWVVIGNQGQTLREALDDTRYCEIFDGESGTPAWYKKPVDEQVDKIALDRSQQIGTAPADDEAFAEETDKLFAAILSQSKEAEAEGTAKQELAELKANLAATLAAWNIYASGWETDRKNASFPGPRDRYAARVSIYTKCILDIQNILAPSETKQQKL